MRRCEETGWGGVDWRADMIQSVPTQIAAQGEKCNGQVVKSRKGRDRSQLLPRRLFVASLSAPATSLVARQNPAVMRRMAPSSTNRHTSKPCRGRVQGTTLSWFSAELQNKCSMLKNENSMTKTNRSARCARGEEKREKREERREQGGREGCVDEMHYLFFSCSIGLQCSIECLLVF